jgi:hypothetical protein
MPRLTSSNPKYRRHKATGQAVVTLAGRDIDLGNHGTAAGKAEYNRFGGEWIAKGRPSILASTEQVSVSEVIEMKVRVAHHLSSGIKPSTQLHTQPC